MQRSTKFAVIGGCGFLASLVSLTAIPGILRFGIRDQTALKKRNEVRGFYLKLPFTMNFNVYFFNVTNPMNVQNGAIPELQEIGPYCYDLYKEKIDIIDNEAEDSLSYSPLDVYKFNNTKSGNLRDDDFVTILHPLVVGIINQVSKDSPALLPIVTKAMGPIFRDPQSIYLTVRVKDILFDGVEIDCRVKEFSAKAVCTQLKQQIPGLKEPEKGLLLFSVLGPRNGTIGKRFKVLRGIKKSKDLGRVMEFDNQKELTIWGSPFCNRFKGTDGWIFPPALTEEEGIWSFSTDLCRNIQAKFIEDTTFKGVFLRKYFAKMGDMENVEEDKCYCPTPKTCLKKGVFDLSKCMGVPIYATLPHFLEADEMYLKQVRGLKPELEDHIIRIHFESMTGTPVEAKKRLQFNFPVKANDKVPLFKSLPDVLHPVFWVEEAMELDGKLLAKVKQVFMLVTILNLVKYALFGASISLLGVAAYLRYKNSKSAKITPVHEVKTVKSAFDEHAGGDDNEKFVNKGKEEEEKQGYINHAMSGHEFDKY